MSVCFQPELFPSVIQIQIVLTKINHTREKALPGENLHLTLSDKILHDSVSLILTSLVRETSLTSVSLILWGHAVHTYTSAFCVLHFNYPHDRRALRPEMHCSHVHEPKSEHAVLLRANIYPLILHFKVIFTPDTPHADHIKHLM